MLSRVASSVLALAALAGAACAQAPQPTEADWRRPDPENTLVVETTKGRIVVEMIPEAAPAHAQRLRELAREGFYDGLVFHRVIDDFMAQTGDPQGTGQGGSSKPDLQGEFVFERGAAMPFAPARRAGAQEEGFMRSLPLRTQNSDMMLFKASGTVPAWGAFCPGVLGMARAGPPDSANSQFFLMRQANDQLEGRYTAFGRVLVGLDVVRRLKVGEPVVDPDRMTRVRLLADIPAAERPDVFAIDTAGPYFTAKVNAERERVGGLFDICDLIPEGEVR